MSKPTDIVQGAKQMTPTEADAGKGFWLWWILATVIGYGVGLSVDQAIYASTVTALSGIAGGNMSTALYGAIVGACSGALQWMLLRRRIGGATSWILASAVGAAAGLVVGAAVGAVASDLIGLRLDVYTAGAIINLLFGACTGAGIGLAQWGVLRGRVQSAGGWVPANIVGLLLGFSIPLGIVEAVHLPLMWFWFGAVAGLLLGVVQWLWLRRALP